MQTYDMITIVKGELDNTKDLLSLIKQQQHMLIHGQYENVEENVALQQKTVARIKAIERYRRNMPVETLPAAEATQLENVRKTLRESAAEIKRVNRQNRQLIRRSLSLVRQQLQLFVGSDQQTDGYTVNGDYSASVPRQVLNTTV